MQNNFKKKYRYNDPNLPDFFVKNGYVIIKGLFDNLNNIILILINLMPSKKLDIQFKSIIEAKLKLKFPKN